MMQEENFILRQELKKLKLDLSSHEVESKVYSREPSESPSNISDSNAEIAKYGRKYSLMVCPWIDAGVFVGLEGRPDIDPLSEERYTNKESDLAGIIAELYDFVPERLHGLMEGHSRFGSNVSNPFILSSPQPNKFMYIVPPKPTRRPIERYSFCTPEGRFLVRHGSVLLRHKF